MTEGAKIRPVDLRIRNACIDKKQTVHSRHICMKAAVKRAHASLCVTAAGKLRDGIRKAEQSIDSGAAMQKLEALIRSSKNV